MASQVLIHKLLENQVFRFVISAGTGLMIDVLAFHLFYHYIFDQKTYQLFSLTLGNYTLSLAISFFMGVVVNFLITRYIVFYESKSRPSKQFVRFASVAVVGYFANLFVIKLLIQTFNFYPDIARITAALSLFFASYFIHKIFSFSLSLKHNAS
jgi:putative flippase GtrA